MTQGICKKCKKRPLVDAYTKVATLYCEHNLTGSVFVPIGSKQRWLSIYPISVETFGNYIADVMGRALKGDNKGNNKKAPKYN